MRRLLRGARRRLRRAIRRTRPTTPADVHVVLRRARWDGDRLRIEGWAYRVGVTDRADAPLRVVATAGRHTYALPAERRRSVEVYAGSTDTSADHAESGFVAWADPAALLPPGRGVAERTWTVRVGIDGGEPYPFTGRHRFGSTVLTSRAGGPGVLVGPTWHPEHGLQLGAARRALSVRRVSRDGEALLVEVADRGRSRYRTAVLRTEGHPDVVLPLVGRATFRVRAADLPEPALGERLRIAVQLADHRGRRRYVHLDPAVELGPSGLPGITLSRSPRGVFRLDRSAGRLEIEAYALVGTPDAPALEVSGRAYDGAVLDRLELAGGRQRVSVEATQSHPDSSFTAIFPLVGVGPWADRPTVLHPGRYRVLDEGRPAEAGVALADGPDERRQHDRVAVGLEVDAGGTFAVRLTAPLPEADLGAYPQHQLGHQSQRTAVTPTDTVFLECFGGKSAGDNTRAVFEELRRRRPDLDYRWTVADGSVPVPDGGRPVLRHSREWWELLTSSRWVITNCGFPGSFRRRPHQRVLQAWHGTPYKTLGLDRPGARARPGYAAKLARGAAQWELLIAQNPFSAERFRAAYGFEGRMLEIGYPRNDPLSRPDAELRRAAVRARLGIAADQTAVLYAPTWREDDRSLFRGLDFDAVVGGLGPSHRLLVRGHANTHRYGGAVTAAGVLDVTLYPDVTDLFLAADLMITDYSSVMFDWAITGRPLLFYVPDLERYTGELRGSYLSLADEAPGPLLRTSDEVVDAVRAPDPAAYADRYRAWQARYTPWDDGHAAERAVDILLEPAVPTR